MGFPGLAAFAVRALGLLALAVRALGLGGGVAGLAAGRFEMSVAFGALKAHADGEQTGRGDQQRDQRPAQATHSGQAASGAKNISITGRASAGPAMSSTSSPS